MIFQFENSSFLFSLLVLLMKQRNGEQVIDHHVVSSSLLHLYLLRGSIGGRHFILLSCCS